MPLDPLNDPLLRAPRSHVPTIAGMTEAAAAATPEQLADFVDAIGAAGGGGGGGNATNLGVVASPTGVTVTSDTGTDGTLPLADGTNAGLMSPAQVTKLAGLPTAAELSTAQAAQDTAIDSKLGATADAIADVLEAAATGAPADLARIQASVSGDTVGKKLRLATFGNSMANWASLSATPSTALSPLQAVFPGSGILQYTAGGNTLGFIYPNARLVANGGISGTLLSTMVARDTLAYSPARKSTSDVLAEYPDAVITHLPINTLRTLTSANYTATMAQAKLDAETIISRLLGGCAVVLDCGSPGNSGAGSADATLTKQSVLEWNAWCKSYLVQKYGSAGYVFIECSGVSYDPATGDYLAGISNDGTHLNGYGMIVLAQLYSAKLQKFFGNPLRQVFLRNYISNAALAAQSNNSWGTFANGFTITANNGTKSNSRVGVVDGLLCQSIEVRGLADWNTVSIAIPFDHSAAATGMVSDLALTI